MTLFFDHALPELAGECDEILFHDKEQRLAVSSYNPATNQGVVTVYNSNGVAIDNEVKHVRPLKILWHPQKAILAVVWDSGSVLIWNTVNGEKTEHSELAPDGVTIINLAWSQPGGKRLASIQDDGIVKSFRANAKAQLQLKPAWEHKIPSGAGAILCRKQDGASSDLAKMAVAAVSGEDLFGQLHPSRSMDLTQTVESLGFFVGANDGKIYFIDAKGQLIECLAAPAGITEFKFNIERSILVTVCKDISLAAFRVTPDSSLMELGKIKLSGKTISCDWAAPGVMVSTTGDSSLKIWDMQASEHHLVQNEDGASMTSVACHNGTVAAALGANGVSFWSYSRSKSNAVVLKSKKSSATKPAMSLTWFKKSLLTPLLAVASKSSAFYLREQEISEMSRGDMQIIQLGPKRLQIIQNNVKIVHDNDVPIYNVALCPPNFTIYSGQSMFIQEMGPNGLATNSGSFESPSQQLAMSAQTVYSFNDDQTKIRCHSLAGVEKQILSLGGFSVKMTINGNYLAAAIVPSTVKVFDLARREAKQTVHRDLTTLGSDIGVVTDIAVNCAANRLSMTTDNGRGESSSRIHIYAPDRQKMFSYDINDENKGPNEDLDRFYPLNMKWDEHDKQLLAIEYASSSEHLVVLVWSTDSEVVSQERIAFPKDGRKFLSLCTPNLHFSTTDSEIRKVPLQDFVGLTECDKTTRVALLDFSRQMALGDLDSAFNSIKLIKNETVWLNLAKRCVYTKRIDVAQVCLANMGNAAAAAALRKVQNEEPVEARVAMLAMQLGMNNEAEELYIQSKRFDLLNKFYQAVGRWDDALTTAKKSDRLHLRSTHYNFAKKCEWEKEYEQAVGHYEESKTHLFEIPRMLFDEPERLKSYVQKNTDMNKWWAQYMEYTGEFEEAEKYYKQCGDYLALARVLCVKEDFNEADKLANETGDSAACLHMARHHELAGDVKQAIHFYTRAGAYNNVIRICKEHGFEDQLFNVALLSQPRDMLLAADHFQKNESTLDKAVLLYHRAGNLAKAIDLVFQQQRFGVLEQLVDELDHSAPPEVLSRCAKFFLEHGRSAKAAHLFILSKSYPRAMQIIIEEDVDMSPRMVELLNLPPDVPGREKIMKAAAQHCYDKTQFADAAKLFQHAGLRQEAMKCLARLGDVKKMVEFAQLARDPSLFILAGNYLRSTNAWQEDPAILKAIVTFYRKARKLDLMTTFFIECAQHQIDSASDYDQALGLLQQAVKQLQSSKADTSEQINILREKAIDYKKFTDVVKAMKSSPSDGIDMVSALMREVHEGNSCVRMADLAAFCVKFHASTNPTKATEYLKLIQKDSDRHVTEFVDAETIKKLKASIAASRAAAQTESEAIE